MAIRAQAFLNDASGPKVPGELMRQVRALERGRQQALIHLGRLRCLLQKSEAGEAVTPQLGSFPPPRPAAPKMPPSPDRQRLHDASLALRL
jgi:hypothetical protein